MAEKKEIYKCDLCGIVSEIVHEGNGVLVCCGKPTKKMTEQTADVTTEKHVPLIEKQENGYLVTVGSTLHPMEEKHYIEWVELIADGVIHRKHLQPNDEPKAFFDVQANEVSAREYCNLHGLWKS